MDISQLIPAVQAVVVSVKSLIVVALPVLTTVVTVGWSIEKVLEIVSKLTPWKWDDNLGVLLSKLLLKFSKKPE